MKKLAFGKKLVALLLTALLIAALAGCGKTGQTSAAQSGQTSAVQSGQTQEPAGTDSVELQTSDQDFEVKYNGGDANAPTNTTVTFLVKAKAIQVESLAKSMYTLGYSAAFSVQDGVLSIDSAENVDANMTEEMAGSVLGKLLPKTLTATAWHVIEGNKVTIFFGDPSGKDEPTLVAEFTLTDEQAAVLGLNG